MRAKKKIQDFSGVCQRLPNFRIFEGNQGFQFGWPPSKGVGRYEIVILPRADNRKLAIVGDCHPQFL